MTDLATFEFQDAILLAATEKDTKPLSRLLKSDYPLTADDKRLLAALVDGEFKRPHGNRPWRATDEIFSKNGRARAAVRRTAFYVDVIKKNAREEKRPIAGIHEWAVQQAFDYLKEKGYHVPRRGSLENYLRRSKKRATNVQRQF